MISSVSSSIKTQLLEIVKFILAPILFLWEKFQEQRHIVRLGNQLPGRPALPILGNVLQVGRDSEEATEWLEDQYARFGKLFRFFLGPRLAVSTAYQEDHEHLLAGHNYLRKGYLYEFLKPWLGTGLLISTGDKWHRRRKILTPAFHFKILEQFVPVFNSCGDELIRQLGKRAGREAFDVWNLIKLFALDVICETTMGVKVNAQTNSESAYVNATNEMASILFKHAVSPWLYPQFIFRFSSLGRRHKACLDVLHGMTDKVILERKNELQKLDAWDTTMDIDELGRRRRLAFLDILLLAARDGSLSDADIREEVDTFMFEGHDTTATAISHTLFLLSMNKDIQDKLYEELESVFDETKPFVPSLQQLSELKYTEMVIKESLRIFPPVPAVIRTITSDYKLPSTGKTVPKGSELLANFLLLHRDEEVFTDHETFDPERFSPDECARRHPFAYLPFSAGSRNCIGQRFAMLELKCIIAKVIWNFRVLPDPEFSPILVWELVLKNKNGVSVKMEERQRK